MRRFRVVSIGLLPFLAGSLFLGGPFYREADPRAVVRTGTVTEFFQGGLHGAN